jgi:hypothetical protein
MNQLHIGLNRQIEPPSGGFLYISDEVPEVRRATIFDPRKHSFNPIKDIEYRKAREIAEILYTISPQGENTLTVRNGRRAMVRALLDGPKKKKKGKIVDVWPEPKAKEGVKRFDRIEGDEEVTGTLDELLMSPLLRKVLCSTADFPFKPGSRIVALLNRAEIGDHDALVLGLLLMAHFKGQVVVPDFGFYGREVHVGLFRERRLIAGVNFLA